MGNVVRGGLWLYARSIMNNVFGFLYWLIISALAGPRIVGVVSAIAGLSSMIVALLDLGTSTGIRRFYGMAIGKGDRRALSTYFWTQLAYLSIVYGTASLTILSLAFAGISVSGLKGSMLLFTSICVVLSISQAAGSLVVSMLRTDVLFAASVMGNVLKFVVGLYLVSMGWGWVGAALGFLCPSLAIAAASLLYALRKVLPKPTFSIRALLSVVIAGLASWIPGVLNIVGKSLGVLTIFGTSGAIETGFFYVASAIASIVLMLSTSMLSLLLPTLSGLERGREESAARVLRVSSSMMFPLAAYLTFYPWLPLSLLGRTYISASPTLSTLLLGALPTTVTTCIASLVYSYGLYRYVMLIGFAANVPRVILYNVLVPRYQGLGAALAYTLGSFSGFAASLAVARRVGFRVGMPTIVVAYSIPLVTAGALGMFHAPWYATAITTMLACAVSYPRLSVVKKSDLRDVGYALMGRDRAAQLYNALKPIIDALFGE